MYPPASVWVRTSSPVLLAMPIFFLASALAFAALASLFPGEARVRRLKIPPGPLGPPHRPRVPPAPPPAHCDDCDEDGPAASPARRDELPGWTRASSALSRAPGSVPRVACGLRLCPGPVRRWPPYDTDPASLSYRYPLAHGSFACPATLTQSSSPPAGALGCDTGGSRLSIHLFRRNLVALLYPTIPVCPHVRRRQPLTPALRWGRLRGLFTSVFLPSRVALLTPVVIELCSIMCTAPRPHGGTRAGQRTSGSLFCLLRLPSPRSTVGEKNYLSSSALTFSHLPY